MGVEYEYAEGAVDAQPDVPTDLSKVTLPEDLLSRLKKAAADYSITDLTDYLDEVNELGADAQSLSERLRHLVDGYDFQGILDILGKIDKR